MLKSAIKSLLPQSVLNTARFMRDRQTLAMTPTALFDASPLRALTAHDLTQIWSDPAITADWNKDSRTIETILRPEDLDRGVNPGDRRALYYLIKALAPKNTLEVGTHIGASTLFIARAAGDEGNISTVDIYDVNDPNKGAWKSCGAPASPRDMLIQAGCENRVEFSAEGALPFMERTNDKFDFIFLDGDHTAPAVYKEISAALKILAPGGVILLHDVFPGGKPLYPDNNIIHGPWQAAARIQSEVPGIKILPLGDLPWPTKQGVNATTLAVAVRA